MRHSKKCPNDTQELLLKRTWEGKTHSEIAIKRLLSKIREEYTPSSRYGASNIISLLSQLEIDLVGYNFSYLTVWQAYLQDINLHEVNFAQADLSKFVFAETLSDVIVAKFSPDGKCLTAGDWTGVIQIWCVADGKKRLCML